MIDFDALVLTPVMGIFGEGTEDPSLAPVYAAPGGVVVCALPDAVFDDAYKALVMGDDGDPAIATVEPVMGVRLARFGATLPVKGGTVTLPRLGAVYEVSDVQPDGKGWAKLCLNRVRPGP